MRSLATLTIVFALIIGVAPQFTNCEAQGRLLTLEGGRQIPMKCHWTARAEIAVAAPLAVVGGLMLFIRQKETRRALSVAGGSLGAFAIMLPTTLIGVCGNPEMICNSTMRPLLILVGSLVIGVSALGYVTSLTVTPLARREPAA